MPVFVFSWGYSDSFLLIDVSEAWITIATIINKLRKIFAVYGICNELVSDNGSQFVSEEFKYSASYIAEMVLQCAIQMSDIPKDIKKLSNEDCLFIFTNVTLVWGPKNVVI
jgi:hypothetical protein